MLQSMRNMSKSWIFKGLMSLLMVSFAIWGVGDMFKTHPGQRKVASVGSIDITAQELNMRFQLSLPEIRQMFGPDIDVAKAKQIGAMDRALDMMMHEETFNQDAKRLGIQFSDIDIWRAIANMKEFQDETGRFNQDRWNMLTRQSGMAESFFVGQKRHEMERFALLQSVVAGAQPPKVMIDTLYQARGAKRILEIVSLRNDSMKDLPSPSQDDLKKIYEDHEEAFTAPEYRGLTVALVQNEEAAKDVVISDDDLKKAYDTRADEIMVPEQRDIVQIVFQDETKANAFYDSLSKSSSFADLAKAKGLTPVALEHMDEKTILPELYTSVFAVEEGEVTPPIKSDLGWHVVQVKKIHEGGKPPFDQAKAQLRQILQDERVGDIIARNVNQLDDSLAAGKTIEDIADSLKLRLIRFSSVDAAGLDKEGKPVKDIPFGKPAIDAAFALNAGESGQVLDDGQGHYFVVRTDQVEPSRLIPFEDVKAKVVALWKTQKQEEAASAAAEEMAKTLREGGKATQFAARSGVEIRLSKPLSQLGDTDKDLPADVVKNNVFKMKKNDVITAKAQDKQLVLRLADIVPVDPKKPEGSRGKIVDNLDNELKLDVLGQYEDEVRKDFPWRIDRDVFNSLKN